MDGPQGNKPTFLMSPLCHTLSFLVLLILLIILLQVRKPRLRNSVYLPQAPQPGPGLTDLDLGQMDFGSAPGNPEGMLSEGWGF